MSWDLLPCCVPKSFNYHALARPAVPDPSTPGKRITFFLPGLSVQLQEIIAVREQGSTDELANVNLCGTYGIVLTVYTSKR